MKPLFQGACTALVTPFRLDFVHTEAYDQLLDRQMKAGIAALVVCGTTGESATMSDTERLDLIGHTVDYVRGRCKVIAGTGSNHTAHAVTLSKEAEKLGADGLLLVSPYYNKATEAGLIAHYTAIADQVHIPCIAYNVPSRTGVDIPVSVYRALAAHPNFCGVKEAGGDVGKIARIRQACGPEFFIWSGNDDQTVPVMALGGLGVISVLSNLYPETVVRLRAVPGRTVPGSRQSPSRPDAHHRRFVLRGQPHPRQGRPAPGRTGRGPLPPASYGPDAGASGAAAALGGRSLRDPRKQLRPRPGAGTRVTASSVGKPHSPSAAKSRTRPR